MVAETEALVADQAISISDIAPANPSVGVSGSLTFTASVTGGAQGTVMWGSSAGTWAGNTWTAPATAQSVTITATSVDDPTKATSTTVIVLATPMASDLIAVWSFGEGLGYHTTDASGWSNDGTLMGGVAWETGKVGSGLSFNGTSGRVSVPTLNLFSGQFTVSAWVKFNAVNRGVDNTILGHGNASTNQGLRCTERSGKAYFGFYGNDLVGVTPLQTGVWTHLVYIFDGVQKKIYVNGVLDAVQNTAPYAGNATNLELGRIPWSPSNLLSGSLDEVRVYRRALTAVEVTSLYGSQVNVTIAPRNVTMASGASQIFRAVVTGNANAAVTWELPDANSGNITTSGVYTAPATIPYEGVVYHVLARSSADPTQMDTITVTVKSGVYVAPQTLALPTNGTYSFTATVTGQTSQAVTWSTAGGSMTSTGLYTAPATPGTYTVTATSISDSTKQDSATVTVGGGTVAGGGDRTLVGSFSFEEGEYTAPKTLLAGAMMVFSWVVQHGETEKLGRDCLATGSVGESLYPR